MFFVKCVKQKFGKWFKDDDHNHQILWKAYQKWLHDSITKIIDKTEEEKFFVLLISMNNNDSRGGVHFQIAAGSTQVFPYEKHFNIMHIINNVLEINVFLWQITNYMSHLINCHDTITLMWVRDCEFWDCLWAYIQNLFRFCIKMIIYWQFA